MKPTDAINHFGSQRAVARALGINQASVSEWVARGTVPHKQQARLVVLSKGKLRLSPSARKELQSWLETQQAGLFKVHRRVQ